MNVRKVYRDLFRCFGRQHWWPGHKGKKRPGFDPSFEIMAGAILTQNTAWTNVERVIEALYRERLLDAKTMKSVSVQKLRRLIRPAGYFNQKAKKLKILAHYLLSLSKQNRPSTSPGPIPTRDELLELWGIGKETADSILLYAFQRPIFVIDVYTRRLCKMHGTEFKEYDDYRTYFERRLPRSAKLFNEFHALIVAWGKQKPQKFLRLRRYGAPSARRPTEKVGLRRRLPRA